MQLWSVQELIEDDEYFHFYNHFCAVVNDWSLYFESILPEVMPGSNIVLTLEEVLQFLIVAAGGQQRPLIPNALSQYVHKGKLYTRIRLLNQLFMNTITANTITTTSICNNHSDKDLCILVLVMNIVILTVYWNILHCMA